MMKELPIRKHTQEARDGYNRNLERNFANQGTDVLMGELIFRPFASHEMYFELMHMGLSRYRGTILNALEEQFFASI